MYNFQNGGMKVHAKVWSAEGSLEEGALRQIENVAYLPFAFHHVAVMPDCHQGYGMMIGGVAALNNAISPNMVGVDIGCGMTALNTGVPVEEIDRDKLRAVMGEIRRTVPVGFNHNKEKQDMAGLSVPTTKVALEQLEKAKYQLGTLGGGNHFIEIQKGDDGLIWLMIHSGSRNVGKQVADYYNKLAVKLNERWISEVPKEWELAFLPTDTQEAQDYIEEMNWCVAFALRNRELMMTRVLKAFQTEYQEAVRLLSINIPHNYAVMENHFGENVWIHRKGATKATAGLMGIIPGSQGTSSYIVEGKGNPNSYNSCSHGAGRKMGRKEASRSLNLEDEIKKLDDIGVIHGIRNVNDLDEAAGAYKDIDAVMENQKELVDIKVKLTPLAVIKG